MLISPLLRKAGRPIETTLISNVIHRKTLQKPMAAVKYYAGKSFSDVNQHGPQYTLTKSLITWSLHTTKPKREEKKN